MPDLHGSTVFITGASRGIGRAIALACAKHGANIVIAAKTAEPHPKLAGTIHSVAAEVEALGVRALPLAVDIRDEARVEAAVRETLDTFGRIDVLVNNASAIHLAGTMATPAKRFDLMHQINTRGTYVCSQACIPALKRAPNPHILTLSPPINLAPKWAGAHVAYTIAKYGMSLCTLGMAHEFAADGIAVNSLWPRTTIHTAAIEAFLPQAIDASRTPAIMADAALAILQRPSRECTGRFFIDEDALREVGVTDFSGYAVKPGTPLAADIFLD
ncbi:MAG: NAD(P)-dependent oxidoreductase [Burkholderiales bacterium]|nr:NAD(P)-dependent oxidoreductase [Burkholderiales bacterium]